jgi:hypothetical protein
MWGAPGIVEATKRGRHMVTTALIKVVQGEKKGPPLDTSAQIQVEPS